MTAKLSLASESFFPHEKMASNPTLCSIIHPTVYLSFLCNGLLHGDPGNYGDGQSGGSNRKPSIFPIVRDHLLQREAFILKSCRLSICLQRKPIRHCCWHDTSEKLLLIFYGVLMMTHRIGTTPARRRVAAGVLVDSGRHLPA